MSCPCHLHQHAHTVRWVSKNVTQCWKISLDEQIGWHWIVKITTYISDRRPCIKSCTHTQYTKRRWGIKEIDIFGLFVEFFHIPMGLAWDWEALWCHKWIFNLLTRIKPSSILCARGRKRKKIFLTQIIAILLSKISIFSSHRLSAFRTQKNYLSKIAFLDEKRATCEDVED